MYVALGVFGGGYALYRLYDARRCSLNDLERQLADERENEELIKAQLRPADPRNLFCYCYLSSWILICFRLFRCCGIEFKHILRASRE